MTSFSTQTDDGGSVEVMVWISSPNDFPNWPADQKLARYEKVMEWHDYIADLFGKGKVTHVWGSHQLLSRAEFTTSQGLLIAVYRVKSWQEFDQLLLRDPLRDSSQYATTPLSSLMGDRDTDFARYERHLRLFLGDRSDPVRERVYQEHRARYNLAPEYVDKYPQVNPRNPRTNIDIGCKTGDPMQFLIMGVNPDEYISMWDDLRKLIHHEKVMWWHSYVAMLIHQRKVSHGWGTNDFCYIAGPKTNSCGAVLIYETQTFDEFDGLYKLDPIRDATQFWSVLLQPIADQRMLDERRLYAVRRGEVFTSGRTEPGREMPLIRTNRPEVLS